MSKMDPIALIKFLEIMDTPFIKKCSCGEEHSLSTADFDLISVPTRARKFWQEKCPSHYKYISSLITLGFGKELDSHLVTGGRRKLVSYIIKLIAIFSNAKVKTHNKQFNRDK